MKIKLYGQLQDLFGQDTIEVSAIKDTDGLIDQLVSIQPKLNEVVYKIVVNHQICDGNTKLIGDESVSLLPPYSGG